jgi:hypothetical protein
MKTSSRVIALAILLVALISASAQTTFTLNGYTSFGPNGDGSVNPGQSIGTSPVTTYPVLISAQNTPSAWFPGEDLQDQRPTGSTNGFNMRGIVYDPTSKNLILCDTHVGSGGTVAGGGALSPFSAIYIMDSTNGTIIGALNTNGMVGGAYTHVVPGVSDDGVVYICNQTTASASVGFKIYRWDTANTNSPNFNNPPVVAFTNLLGLPIGTSGERPGLTMDVRGSGPNTQIICGTAVANGTGTNIFIFTTADGTNFSAHRLSFPGVITTATFNDGIAWGPGNTFWAKQVAKPLLYLAYDAAALAAGGTSPNGNTNAITGTVISSFSAASVNDPLLNICAIAYDPVNKLLAGLEEIGGIANGGRGKVWLFHHADPTNRPPAVLASRTYTPNNIKATAPMGYLRFGNGKLYANVVNNGLLASAVDSVGLSAPTFTLNLPATTRVGEGFPAHFEVFAVTDITNYQWYSNNLPIAGANNYYYDLPNASTSMGSPVFKVVAMNAAGSATSVNSTLTVVSASSFLHPVPLWSVPANTNALSNGTNFITSTGSTTTPNERAIAYNALSNQLLVARGSLPANFQNIRIFVIDADRGTNGAIYTLKTNGLSASGNVTIVGLGVADDGAVYAATAASDNSFKVYRWADSGSNTLPVVIFGTNSSAGSGNPIGDLLGSTTFRFGDNLAVRGSGNNTEILLDSQNSTRFASILTPIPDGFMTNWTETGYLLQNTGGSYGSEAYGTAIGRSLQFGPGNTFYQKRYNAGVGAPLARMSYSSGGGIAPLDFANVSPSLYTNGPMAVNTTLGVAAGINFIGGVATDSSSLQDTINYYDISDPSQAVLLSTQPCPQGIAGFHKGNQNAIGQIIFGANPNTGVNYMFVINGNNGVAAFTLSGGVVPPPLVVTQPRNLRALQGSSGSFSVTVDQVATTRWYKDTNTPAYTGVSGLIYNIANAQLSDAGDYFAIITNVNGAVTSQVAHVTVSLPNDNFSLSTNWTGIPGAVGNLNYPYVTTTGGANTPRERMFAYNALSNQLIIVSCPPASTAFTNYVVDGSSGALLYTLNTSGVVHEGTSDEVGSNPIDMVGAAAGEDGSIYICNESPNASGGVAADPSKMFIVYRWTNSAPTTPPVIIYTNDPSGQLPGLNLRWGDVMSVRGTGMNTEIAVNTTQGSTAAILKPADPSLNVFTNAWFSDSGGGGSIGRSLQFGATNTVYTKRKGSTLLLQSYDTGSQSSAGLVSMEFSTTLGGVAVDPVHKLAIGVDFIGATAGSDAVALYDITDPATPMLIKRYSFPSSFTANANAICQTVVWSNRVYSLDGNNGMLALFIDPPVNSMALKFSRSGGNVNLSWGNNQAILQGSSSVSPTSWADLTSAGVTNSVQSANSTNKFYRLIQRL